MFVFLVGAILRQIDHAGSCKRAANVRKPDTQLVPQAAAGSLPLGGSHVRMMFLNGNQHVAGRNALGPGD